MNPAPIRFDDVVRESQRSIYNLAYRFLGNHYDADEAMQKTFLKAYEKLDSFRGDSSLKTWIYKIAVNTCKNFIRDRKNHRDIDDKSLLIASAIDQQGLAIEKQRQELLRQKIDRLPAKQKEAVLLRVYEDLPFSEIARILDQSENASKVNFHLGMKRLKELLKGYKG